MAIPTSTSTSAGTSAGSCSGNNISGMVLFRCQEFLLIYLKLLATGVHQEVR